MEDTPVLSLKLAENKISLNSYEDRLSTDVYHFQSRHDESGAKGFGSDFDSNLALIKSLAELVERKVFREIPTKQKIQNSSGFAAHTKLDGAKRCAKLELIERDAFLLSWLSKTAPSWIEYDSLFEAAKKQVELFKAKGLNLQLGVIAKVGANIVAIASLRPLDVKLYNFGFVIATSAKFTYEQAVLAVALDLRRSATVVLNLAAQNKGLFSPITENEIVHPYQHMEFYLNPENLAGMEWFWDSNKEILDLEEPEFTYSEFNSRIDIGIPLFITKAEAEELQPYFTGSTVREKINIKRLNEICGNDINFKLHPLG